MNLRIVARAMQADCKPGAGIILLGHLPPELVRKPKGKRSLHQMSVQAPSLLTDLLRRNSANELSDIRPLRLVRPPHS